MKCFVLLLLPLPAFGWWCETSDRHGCRGQSRHFVREAAVANPFLVFEDIKTFRGEEPIVVDWDHDGDLDVILKKSDGLSLFEFKSGKHFVEVKPNPFHGIPGGYGQPAVVDWDGDGGLDLIVGAEDEIQYYHKGSDGQLHQRLGAENPFEHIRMLSRLASDLSIGDWDGDGDLDVLHSNPLSPVQYFEQSEGQLVLLEGPKSPFYEIANLTVTHRPIMADWNGDGNMDLVLLAKFVGTSDIDQNSLCTSYLYEQHKIGGKTALVFKDETFFRNEGCSSFDGSGASFVDVDKDGDLDAICGSYNGPLRVYNHTAAGLVKPSKFPSNSIPLDMIQLESEMSGKHLNFLHPVLADWDLDGDLDLALLHPLGHKHPEKNRYFLHLPDDTVTELNGPPNSSCPIDWGRHFSVADFDGDGKNDLLGFASHRGDGTDDLVGYLGHLVVVCLQTSSGFVVVEPEKIPFNYLSNCPQCLTNVSWIVLYGGFPSFLDWDGDGDLDVLRKNLADQALARWWQRHRMVLGATDDGKGIYIWWCLFVNNQFRLLEEGQTQDTNDFFHVFGQQVEGIGKMLMCLDQIRGSQYTSRIWCIFEVFVACQRSIPTTVILPELEVGAIETLEDLTQQCRVDAEKAKASVQADADAIKERIQKEHQSFEYVNKTVEQALWCEVIKFLEQSQQEPEEIELSTQTPQDSDLSTSSAPVSAMLSADSQCSLQ